MPSRLKGAGWPARTGAYLTVGRCGSQPCLCIAHIVACGRDGFVACRSDKFNFFVNMIKHKRFLFLDIDGALTCHTMICGIGYYS